MAVNNKIRINVKVADKVFPMTISPEDERDIRIAAEQVTMMDERYSSRIVNDAERMSAVALQLAIQNIKNVNKELIDSAAKELKQLCNDIDKITKKQL